MREEQKLIEKELKTVEASIKKIGVLVHWSRLQCPNIRNSQKNIEGLLRGRTDVRRVNGELERICHGFICTKSEQIYPCMEKHIQSCKHRPGRCNCRFLEEEYRNRVRISALLVRCIGDSIG